MQQHKAAILGGLIAGVVTTACMVAGRKTGLLTKTLDRDAVDWIDRMTGSRDVIGDTGTSVVEFVNHLGASAAFGAALPTLRNWAPNLSPVALGTLYGTALYATNIVGIARCSASRREKCGPVRARRPSAGPCTCCRPS